MRETVTEITKFTNSLIYIRKIKIENNSDDKINLINNLPSDNSGLAQLGFRALSKLVLYLEVQSLIYTFGQSNPQLTPSHGTLPAIFPKNEKK